MDFDELLTWFNNRPKWLQECACRMITKKQLSEQDILELSEMCKNEAKGIEVKYSGIPNGSFNVQDPTLPVKITSISDVNGINAIISDTPLEFYNTPINIVYGPNGSGKSGYVRLLKQACGSRNSGTLLPNIYNTDSQSQNAIINFQIGNTAKTSTWSGEPIKELRGVDIYDTECGLVYINEENEVAYEPWLLQLFTKLTDACAIISSKITTEFENIRSALPSIPLEYSETKSEENYKGIHADLEPSQLQNITSWSHKNEAELKDIIQRLEQPNPIEKALTLRKQYSNIKILLKELKDLYNKYDNSECNKYLELKNDVKEKRELANNLANDIFSAAPLEGIGSDEWRNLWDSARSYSEKQAYKLNKFPNIESDARCVLCQQSLNPNGKSRMQTFEEFIKGDLQSKAAGAKELLIRKFDSFPVIPSEEVLDIKIQLTGILNPDVINILKDFVRTLSARKESLANSKLITDVAPLVPKSNLVCLINVGRDLLRKERAYKLDSKQQNRPTLEQNKKELLAQKWVSEQKIFIETEIANLKTKESLTKAIVLTNTTALSRKKSTLTEELITKAYIQRFHDELKELNAEYISVDIEKTHTEVGRVYHRVYLKNANSHIKTSQILSEGELRIVSLAAILADTKSRESKMPFIFDDPISSLDHTFEELAAKRLVQLSQSRQLIVFTHRLSLIGYITKYAEKEGIKPEINCLSQYHIGRVTELPINLRRTDRSVSYLLNEGLSKIRKALKEGDTNYEIITKGICTNIRILLERIVEMDLLNQVVRRFSPEVNTKGRIIALSKITESECKFIDDYMTKYSRFEHSQSDEAPIPLPMPDEIEIDLTSIKKFITDIRNRNN